MNDLFIYLFKFIAIEKCVPVVNLEFNYFKMVWSGNLKIPDIKKAQLSGRISVASLNRIKMSSKKRSEILCFIFKYFN
jgi:hypothetical protein